MSAFLKVALISSAAFACEWVLYDIKGNEVLLDLTPLTNVTMETIDSLNGDKYYTFTPCWNGLACPGSSYKKTMAIQSSMSNRYNCESLGYWDNEQSQPTMFYDTNGDIAFSFTYFGDYNYSVCNNRLEWNPIFICNEYYEYQMGDVFQSAPCVYTVNIYTKYACNAFPHSSTWDPWTSWISSTNDPWDNCLFETDDGEHELDMSQIGGQEIKYQDRNNSNLYYVYTPCTNTIRCADNTMAMSYIFDIQSFECKKYLAQWEYGDVEPSYSPKNKIWEFVYTNGQKCNGLEEILVVDIICDPRSKTPKMTQAQQNGCVYTLNINSSIACY